MLSADLSPQNTEVYVHSEQGSFVDGGAELCVIVFNPVKQSGCKTACSRPVKGRYVTLTTIGMLYNLIVSRITIYSKCKYVCSYKC